MNNNQPVYIQIIQLIENDIISGVYQVDDLIISTTQMSKLYSVNPTTAVKAIGKLTDNNLIYKKVGIGMCVSEGAREKIIKLRKDDFMNHTITTLINEARTLEISIDELIEIIKEKEK